MADIQRSPGNTQLASIQFLRAIAAASVLVQHTFAEMEHKFHGIYNVTPFPWHMGVDIFFVISGFIMVFTSFDAFGKPHAPVNFAVRRIIRVVPLYYIFTTLMVLALLAFPESIGKTSFDIKQIITSYLFWPYERHDGRISPVLSLGWTLNYEMFFYALFTIALMLPRRIGLIALSTTMLILPIVGALLGNESTALTFFSNSIVIEFLLGAWIAIALKRRGSVETKPLALGALLTVAIISACAMHLAAPDSWPRLVTQGVPAALIVYACTLCLSQADGARIPKPLLALGDSSYALYLSHRFPMRGMSMAFGATLGFSSNYAWLYFALVIGSCLVFAHLAYMFVEKPLLKITNRLILRRV